MSKFSTEQEKERAILIGVQLNRDANPNASEDSLKELVQLAKTAGAAVIHYCFQKKDKYDSAYHIGKGKAEEIKRLAEMSNCNLLIFDDELSTRKVKNIEKLFEIKVIDRTELILAIFAARAKSNEGILQVDLAQHKYQIKRLAGKGLTLSRQGGGIGTKGPGEKKLETDRRVLREKIKRIEIELEKVQKSRDLHRQYRKKQNVPVVAIIGYTNAGKSTLFTKLTSEGVLVDDMLFATLDPVVRKVDLGDDKTALLVDTVGFIRKLPHHLVEAFKSTLEELTYANLLLKVIDISHPQAKEHEKVIDTIVSELNADNIPELKVLNKTDQMEADIDIKGNDYLYISALQEDGLCELKDKIRKAIFTEKLTTFTIPAAKGDVIAKLYRFAVVKSQKTVNDMIIIEAEVEKKTSLEFKEYILSPL